MPNKSVICTLFEGNYHYGVAALVNSLQNKGFKGDIYAGYKGTLSNWSSFAFSNYDINWKDAKTLRISDDINIHFLPVDTKYHLTNYKPFFLLDILKITTISVDGIFYFDPDIVIKCEWFFFEKWISHGVALVHEIISNDMPFNHPIRKGWEELIFKTGGHIFNKIDSYINAGFFGLQIQNINFLYNFSKFIEFAVNENNSDLTKIDFTSRVDLFFAKDQDALNIAAMCSDVKLSEMGPEAMDFLYGGFTMSHAVGSPKPWNKNFILSSFYGKSPTLADKEFWKNVQLPIKIYPYYYYKLKTISIKISTLVGRFYKKY